MKHKFRNSLLASLIGILLLGGCQQPSVPDQIAESFDLSELPEKIKDELRILKKDTFHTHYFDSLDQYYGLNGYNPIWLGSLQDSAFRADLGKIDDSIVYDGLKPEHYMLDSVRTLLRLAARQKVPLIYKTLARADLYLSNYMLALWHDKVLGRSDPRQVLGMKYTLPYPAHPRYRLYAVLDKDSAIRLLSSYRPRHNDYGKLRSLLLKAYAATAGSETMLDSSGIRRVKPGDSCDIVPQLAVRLVELGLAPDSIVAVYAGSRVYKKALSEYIKAFQRNSNLSDDGILGKSTLKMLNASHNDKIDEIRANMERIRWFGTEPDKPYVRVNIPEFMLYMYWPDSVKTLPVCVGQGKERYYDQKLKKYVVSKSYLDKPMNHETPQVYSNIDFVVLNPTWTVPSSIVGREMYNHIVRDPGYLARNNYTVLKNGVPVNPWTIRWRKLKPGNIPYTIRQNAGDDNSLGKIKFTFKNPFDVYLHDTPLKNKFKLSNRAVSHGCVRVQNPVELTGFVLQQNVKNTYDDVLIMMGLPPTDTARARIWMQDSARAEKIETKTRFIRVEKKMTVFFDYRSIVFDESGAARYIFDVYDKNSLILEAINRP